MFNSVLLKNIEDLCIPGPRWSAQNPIFLYILPTYVRVGLQSIEASIPLHILIRICIYKCIGITTHPFCLFARCRKKYKRLTMRCEIERSSLLARAIHVSTQLINLPDIVIFAHTWHETRISRFNSCISFVLWKNVRRMMAKDHEEDVFDKQEDCRLTMEERSEAKRGGFTFKSHPRLSAWNQFAARHWKIAASSSSSNKELPYPHTAGW